MVANVSGQRLDHRSRSTAQVVPLVDLHERVIGTSQHGLGVYERLHLTQTSVLTSLMVLKKPVALSVQSSDVLVCRSELFGSFGRTMLVYSAAGIFVSREYHVVLCTIRIRNPQR